MALPWRKIRKETLTGAGVSAFVGAVGIALLFHVLAFDPHARVPAWLISAMIGAPVGFVAGLIGCFLMAVARYRDMEIRRRLESKQMAVSAPVETKPSP